MPVFKKLFQSFKRLFQPQRASSLRKKPRLKKRLHPKRKPIKRKSAIKKPLAKKPVRKIKEKARPKPKLKPRPKTVKIAAAPKEALVGEVTHYFNKIGVIVIKMKSGTLAVGEPIHIKGRSTDFTQRIASLQIESVDVKVVKKGQLAGLKVTKAAKPGDGVYKLLK